MTHNHIHRSTGPRGRLLATALAVASVTVMSACSENGSSGSDGADFPPDELTVIAAGDPGGGLDSAARQVLAGMEDAGVDADITVENNGGGGGNPARAEVAAKGTDGATVVAESNRVFLNPLLGTTDLNVDDFTPLAQLTNDYLVWAVRADSEYESAEQILDKVKEDPASVDFGVGTVPSDDQINILKAAKEYGVEDLSTLNIVAFQSGGDLNTELLGGHVEVVSTGLSEAAALAESGDIRLLSISSSEPQSGPAEGVPTWSELGLDITVDHWRGIFGAGDMPEEAVAWWEENLEAATETEEWQAQMEKASLTTDFASSDEFTEMVNSQAEEYEALLTEVGLAE